MVDDKAVRDAVQRRVEILNGPVREAIAEAFKDGFAAGRAQAIQSIMSAVSKDLPGTNVPIGSSSVVAPPAGKSERAPRGSVRPVVLGMLLAKEPEGEKTGVLGIEATRLTAGAISSLSVANELRRQKGTLYRQNGHGYWFLTDEGRRQAIAAAETSPDPEKDEATEPSEA